MKIILLAFLLPFILKGQEVYSDEAIKDSLVVDCVLNYGHNADEQYHGVSIRENPAQREEHNWRFIETHTIHNPKYFIGTLAGIRVCDYCQRREEVHYVLYGESKTITKQQLQELARRHE